MTVSSAGQMACLSRLRPTAQASRLRPPTGPCEYPCGSLPGDSARPAPRQARVWPPVGVGRAGGLICQSCESPAVALIVGAGLAWTVSMISELSIPWR